MDSFRPLVRFAGFEGEWKKVRLGDLFDIGNGYTPSKNVPQFWTNGTIPWFRMEDIRENGRILKDSIQHVTKEAVKSTGLFPANSIIISTTATIGEHALLIADSLANQQFSFLVRKLNRIDSMDIMFIFYHCFLLGDWCRSKSNAGGLLAVNMEDLRNYYFSLPSLPEQQKISEYFTEIDRAISLQTEKLSKLKQIKAASLQNMFPQEGQMLPKVRFAGFEGEWERVCIGDLGTTYSGLSGKGKSDFGDGNAFYITFLNVLNNAVIDVSKLERVNIREAEKQNMVRKGDLLFNTSSETPEEVGFCSFVADDLENVYLNSFCFGLRIDSSICGTFFSYIMRSNVGRRLMAFLAQGATRYNLSKKNFCNSFISLPSLPEQQAIANYFTKLDRKIELETQKLEKLKQIKSACLSKMFV